MLNANVEITHNRLVTSMTAKAIMPALKDLKMKINNTNQQIISQYRMMSSAHNRYNLLFRQTHKTQMIHHLALLLLQNYITIQVGTLQRIHRQYIRYESALDDTMIGIENLNSGYLMHRILDPQVLSKYLEVIEDDLEETAPDHEPVLTDVYQYYGTSRASFINTNNDLLLQLPILIKLKVQIPMSLYSIEMAPVPLDAETYMGDKREYTQTVPAFICDVLLVVTLIAFFIKYQKTMQAMLMAFISMNTKSSGILTLKANPIMRTFPPLFTINLPEEENVMEEL